MQSTQKLSQSWFGSRHLEVLAGRRVGYGLARKIMSQFVRLALIACTLPLFAAGTGLRAQGSDASEHSGAVVRTVRALVEFTRWPQSSNPVDLCVAGPASHAGQLSGVRLSDGRSMQSRAVAASPGALGGCDVVYIGRLSLAGQRQLTAAVRGRGVLTVAEADPDCRSEAMFCLIYPAKGLSFRLNIDAVSRSGLRVDPRVLRVSQGGG